jgi:hypothetical protein
MQINSQPLHPLKHHIYTWNILLQMGFKTSVRRSAAICTNIVKPLLTASEGN